MLRTPRTQRRHGTIAALGCAAAALLVLSPAARGAGAAPVALHPAVGDTIDAREAARFGLFTDAPGLHDAVIMPAPWGGYLVRLRLGDGGRLVTRERNVTTSLLRDWRARVEAVLNAPAEAPAEAPADTAGAGTMNIAAGLAGGVRVDLADTVRVAVADTLPGAEPGGARAAASDTASLAPPAERPGRMRVWPQVPLPAPRPRPPGLPPEGSGVGQPVPPAKWLAAAGFGYRRCLTDFDRFFTDQGLFEVAFSRRLTESLTPYFAFQVGFGDIQDAFEEVSANGRSALYALELGLLARTPLGRRTHLYIGGGGGYYMRSLRWGGEMFIATDGYVTSGLLVWELQDWGFAARTGVQLEIGPARRKQRLLDFQLHYESYGSSEYSPFGPDSPFYAAGHDHWLAFSVSLVSGL